MLLRDNNGKPVGFLDGERVRDDGGRTLLSRSSDDEEEYRLGRMAAVLMTGRLSAEHRPTPEDFAGCLGQSERKVLLDLAPVDVVTPSARSVVSLGANDMGCVADEVSRVRLVARDRGYVWTQNAKDIIRLALPAAGSEGIPVEIQPTYSKISFTTVSYGFAAKIPRLATANADFDLKAQVVRDLIELARLARETRVYTLLTTAGSWMAANRIAAVAKWNGGATANPLTDMFGALAASYLPACHIVMPEVAAQFFFQNVNSTAMRDYVQSGGEMPKVMFARAKSLVGGVASYLWAPAGAVAPTSSTSIALIRSPEDPDRIPTTLTARWLGDDTRADGRRVEGFFVRSWKDESGGAFGSDWITVVHNDAEIMHQSTDPTGTQTAACQVGALITGALA